ncbi:hydrogenase cytochrome b-type subunit [Azoarcus olearius]|uniref:cytochrome b/b6 domain-containing protein n=1 Tax=Azoarcus sp. (strain BH72) TaxID=418699 RepID=UPI00080620EF|nr:cytochrome b/b6 domain-containing protein [Azoarcus olearius]ANQ85497.1 hydrogenase cytochrome b-type subunit [Azoarcus olearius]
MKRVHIWDLPTRLFHWLLAFAILAAYVTGQIGGNYIVWHGRIGLFIVGLVAFRLVWGFIGAPTARFASFVRGFGAIRAYLAGSWHGIGHNPLGALSVLALLGLVGAQAVSGLFANDDISFQGPLAGLVSEAASARLTGLHELLQNVLLGVVGLHLAAIVFYVRIKRDNLVRPMLTGWKELGPGLEAQAPSTVARAGRLRPLAFGVALALAVASVYAAAGGWLAEVPASPAPAAAPGW